MMQVMSDEEVATRNAELKLELRVGTIFISQYLFPERKYCRMVVGIETDDLYYYYCRYVELNPNRMDCYLETQYLDVLLESDYHKFEDLGCITIISQPEKAND